jgi:hypothetical protein
MPKFKVSLDHIRKTGYMNRKILEHHHERNRVISQGPRR